MVTTIWVLMKGEAHEGGQIVEVYAKEADARKALAHEVAGLQERWDRDSLTPILKGNGFQVACDQVWIAEYRVRT